MQLPTLRTTYSNSSLCLSLCRFFFFFFFFCHSFGRAETTDACLEFLTKFTIKWHGCRFQILRDLPPPPPPRSSRFPPSPSPPPPSPATPPPHLSTPPPPLELPALIQMFLLFTALDIFAHPPPTSPPPTHTPPPTPLRPPRPAPPSQPRKHWNTAHVLYPKNKGDRFPDRKLEFRDQLQPDTAD